MREGGIPRALCSVVQRDPDLRGHFRSNCCDSLAQTCCSDSTLSCEAKLPDISWNTSSSSQYRCSCERFPLFKPASSVEPVTGKRSAAVHLQRKQCARVGTQHVCPVLCTSHWSFCVCHLCTHCGHFVCVPTAQWGKTSCKSLFEFLS